MSHAATLSCRHVLNGEELRLIVKERHVLVFDGPAAAAVGRPLCPSSALSGCVFLGCLAQDHVFQHHVIVAEASCALSPAVTEAHGLVAFIAQAQLAHC